MKFTTPCFIRIIDAEKRKDMIEWCLHIGYEYIYPPKEERLSDKVICDTYCVGVAHDAQTFTALNCIDCGTNIELFKALAAMNKNNWDEQYVIDNAGNIGLCNVTPDASGMQCRSIMMMGLSFNIDNYRKATVEEIVEYFKNNEK